jgi:hypothetical protein
MIVTKRLREGYHFFKEHAGYATPPGRAACALELAKAELAGREAGFEAEWMEDPDGWHNIGDCPTPSEVLACIVRAPSGGEVSLWGIGDPSRDYMRVVEAELTSELLAEEHARQVTAWERSG